MPVARAPPRSPPSREAFSALLSELPALVKLTDPAVICRASTTFSSDDIYFFRSSFFISGPTRSAVGPAEGRAEALFCDGVGESERIGSPESGDRGGGRYLGIPSFVHSDAF